MARAVLLTGGSAFTGLWIARALAEAGFGVVAPLRRGRGDYAGLRGLRVQELQQVAEVVFEVPFGSQRFLELARATPALCALAHHAAEVGDHRSPDFDAVAAFRRNMEGAEAALRALADGGARLVLLTGTVFEAGEGGAGDPMAVTPYGLSKTLTSSAFAHLAAWAGLGFSRFVVPSPYGLLEEPRFGAYLFRSWRSGQTPVVRAPRYVRDHIPAPVLASAYVAHLRACLERPAPPAAGRPSWWIATQGDFARKVAAEAAPRLGRDCPLAFAAQPSLEEPYLRVNTEPCAPPPGWDEARFWDEYVEWRDRC